MALKGCCVQCSYKNLMNALHVSFVFLEEKLLNLKGVCSALFFGFAYKYERRQIIAAYQIQDDQSDALRCYLEQRLTELTE